MTIEKTPFRATHEEKVRDSFTVNLNKVEREMLEKGKELIHNYKDSTAIKKLAWIGLNEIQSDKMQGILSIIYEERRKAKKRGML